MPILDGRLDSRATTQMKQRDHALRLQKRVLCRVEIIFGIGREFRLRQAERLDQFSQRNVSFERGQRHTDETEVGRS